MAISGTATSAASATITPATGSVGDLMIIFAYRTGSNTAPTLPAGWTALDNTGGSSNAFRSGYKIATLASEPSVTWTNATQTICWRLSGQAADPAWIGGTTHNTGTGTTVTYGAVTLTGANSNWMVSDCGAASATALGTQTSYARDTAVGSAPLSVGEHIRNPAGTSHTVTATGSGTWISWQQEVLAATITAAAAPTFTATITATETNAKPVAAAPTFTAARTATGTSSKPVGAAPTFTAARTATGTSSKPVGAAPTFTAARTATGTTSKPVAAAPTFTAARTATATNAKPVAAAPTFTAARTATGTTSKPVAATRPTAATFTPAPDVTKPDTAARTTTAAITATGTTTKPVAAAPVFTAAITATATLTRPITASLALAATITAAAEVIRPTPPAVFTAGDPFTTWQQPGGYTPTWATGQGDTRWYPGVPT